MQSNILITGASGYLGGTLLTRWADAGLSGYSKLFALVRKPEQAEAVRRLYGAAPLQFTLDDEKAVYEAIVSNNINIFIFQIDAYYLQSQLALIKALAALKDKTGQDVHFIYASGTKQFSSHAGAHNDGPLSDPDPKLYEIHRAQKASLQEMQEAVETNCRIIELSEDPGVKAYIFPPCIVYGQGEGFDNKVSTQTVDVVHAALPAKGVYNPGNGSEASTDQSFPRLKPLMAQALAKRGLIPDATVRPMTGDGRQQIAEGLGVTPSTIDLKIGGNSTYQADHGHGGAIGWAPMNAPSHILQVIDDEVELILHNLHKTRKVHSEWKTFNGGVNVNFEAS